ncbi:MAG: hypothetical protein H6760_02495 [Candidatus Nomurabacteria bacterium]|nr:MAG: hypothetical protein H6760_02495 [Candidatus Nomurabacteria bacterium]
MENTNAQIIKQGLRYLQNIQTKEGGFLSQSSPLSEKNPRGIPRLTSFFTSHVLFCLAQLREYTETELIIKKAEHFLRSQINAQGSFNYWNRTSTEATQIPYPDDLDDTICGWNALHLLHTDGLSGAELAKLTQLLIHQEEQPGGPYRTWLLNSHSPDGEWSDTDLAVNAHIARLLRYLGVKTPRLDAFLENALRQEVLLSRYYPSSFPILYALSYRSPQKHSSFILRHIKKLQLPDGTWGNPLHNALAIETLRELGIRENEFDSTRAQQSLREAQEKGAWPAIAYCIDPCFEGEQMIARSSALTTAYCLLALHQKEKKSPVTIAKANESEARFLHDVHQILSYKITSLAPELQDQGKQTILHFIEKKENAHIALLSLLSYRALSSNILRSDYEYLLRLAINNIYGWIAYGIYDHILDEKDLIEKLPLANVLLRTLQSEYTKLLQYIPGGITYLENTLNAIDAANAWEIDHCRLHVNEKKLKLPQHLPAFKDLSQLAQKSFGHALPAITVFALHGYSLEEAPLQHLQNFFKHFLIARQLNDDAHDWLTDLTKGRITPANLRVIKKISTKEINFQEDLTKLKKMYWEECINDISQEILQHIAEAKNELGQINIANPEYLSSLLHSSETAAKEAKKQSKQILGFLKNFHPA